MPNSGTNYMRRLSAAVRDGGASRALRALGRGLHPIRSRRTRVAGLLAVLAVALGVGACTDIVGTGNRNLEIIWPRDGARLYGEEVLRARVRGLELDEYEIYWYVDDGREWRMFDEWHERPPHKSEYVDTWFWDWNGRGPYTIGFIAEDRRGRQIGRRTVRVYVD